MSSRKKAALSLFTGLVIAVSYILQMAGNLRIPPILFLISALFAGIPIALTAFKALRFRAFSIELLVTIAVTGALFIGEYSEAAVVSFLFIVGSYLESRTLEKTRGTLRSLLDQTPKEATVVKDGVKQIIPAEKIEAGDRVCIHSGERIAADGVIVAGTAYIQEANITGEPIPVDKAPGSRVYSGTIVDHGYIEMEAERVGEDTAFARIIELVEEAQEKKTKTERFLNRFAAVYTPLVVGLSLLVYAVTRNVEFTLTFLVIACPGALVISAPVSMVAGIGSAAKHGVLVKGGEGMERLAKADVFVFDKTGTLTMGQPALVDIKTYGMDGETLLQKTAAAESGSEHLLGRTIVKEAAARGLLAGPTPAEAELVVVKGQGIRYEAGGERIEAGSRRLLAEAGIALPPEAEKYASEQERLGHTVVFAAVNGRFEGMLSIADKIRPEAARVLSRLREQGMKKLYMLTGDNARAARLVGEQLGLDGVYGDLLPEQKAAKIQEWKDAGCRVAMIGDGINDAPAIAAADVGLAIGAGGTDAAMETADIVLMSGRLDPLVHARNVSAATVRNMRQNTVIALGTVGALLAGVLLQRIFLAAGMLVHELSVLLVILNAVRLTRIGATGKHPAILHVIRPKRAERGNA